MLLAVDIGNTQTSLGVFDAPGPRSIWRLSTRTRATADELATQLSALLTGGALAPADITVACVCSVVPALARAWTGACAALGLPAPLCAAELVPADLGLTPEQCARTGADRLANALAARQGYGAPSVVVDFGTATNFDVIDEAGHFIGGPISAGLQLSADALAAKAARLVEVDLAAPSRIIATTTEDALRAGLVLGEAAKVDGLTTRIIEELGADPGAVPVVATGGLAPLVAPHARTITAIDPTLTLVGLYLLAERASKDAR
ncbi:MAG: type III pantothenate kinase [Actinomycetia bacterium]|nr:type III pantothenate kinase [Actinomycetes bacterium]